MNSNRHYRDTDCNTIFLSKEKHKLFFPDKTYGLSTSGISHLRSISVLLYACMICFKYIFYYFKLRLLEHSLRFVKNLSFGAIIRKVRKCRGTFRHKALSHIAVDILILLFLCGDIHPNPGPFLSGSTRHPHLQLLTVGAWNVRTLLETKRTHTHPTAIVARELDRYGIDIAALSETSYLGDTVK